MRTATESTGAGFATAGMMNQAVPAIVRLKNIGVDAESRNRSWLLRTPCISAAMEISRR